MSRLHTRICSPRQAQLSAHEEVGYKDVRRHRTLHIQSLRPGALRPPSRSEAYPEPYVWPGVRVSGRLRLTLAGRTPHGVEATGGVFSLDSGAFGGNLLFRGTCEVDEFSLYA